MVVLAGGCGWAAAAGVGGGGESFPKVQVEVVGVVVGGGHLTHLTFLTDLAHFVLEERLLLNLGKERGGGVNFSY